MTSSDLRNDMSEKWSVLILKLFALSNALYRIFLCLLVLEITGVAIYAPLTMAKLAEKPTRVRVLKEIVYPKYGILNWDSSLVESAYVHPYFKFFAWSSP